MSGRAALRRSITRLWPEFLVKVGTLTDKLPANIDYVPNSANPPAAWDAASRTLTWNLADVPLGTLQRFSLRIMPLAEGRWPTNVLAEGVGTDGWGNPIRAVLPIPEIRVLRRVPDADSDTHGHGDDYTVADHHADAEADAAAGAHLPADPLAHRAVQARLEERRRGGGHRHLRQHERDDQSRRPHQVGRSRDAARSFLKQLGWGRTRRRWCSSIRRRRPSSC